MGPTRRALMAVALLALVGTAVSAGSTTAGTQRPTAKPVIGPPLTVPAQAVAGKRFAVSFKVTRSDTGTPLTSGTMICDPSVTGKVIPHAESFRGGTARLSFVIPASAKGMLKVKVTIKAAGQSATKVASFRIVQVPKPSLTIGDSSVAEGNTGTTTLSFPVTLSAASTEAVSVHYATADGTATAPADYTAATGTLSFKPGEKAKTIAVSVIGELSYEPDETLTVTLSNPVNATIADGSAAGLITNDDTLAMPGHYTGKTSQNETVEFDVTSTGTGVTGLRTGQINQSCSPGGTISGGRLDFGSDTYPINADGSFTIDVTYQGTVSGGGETAPTTTHVVITGRFSGSTASGTLLKTITFTLYGMDFSCTSYTQTWTATRA